MAAKDKDQKYSIRYRFSCKLFLDDGTGEFEPIKIQSITNVVKYNNLFTPMMTITLELTADHVGFIKKNDNRLLLHLTKEKLKYLTSKDSADKTLVENDIVFEQLFIPLVESDDTTNLRDFPENPSKDENAGPLDIATINERDRALNIYTVRMYLTTLDYHMMFKKTYNTVLRSKGVDYIQVDTALRFIAETCGCKGFIIDKPDNIIPFENIIIPPGNVKYTLDALQVTYGLYLKGILSFFDHDGKLYILNRLSLEHDYEEGKVKDCNLYVYSKTDNTDGDVGGMTMYETDSTVAHTVFKGVKDNSLGIVSGEAYGDSIAFTNYGFGMETFSYKDGKFEGAESPARQYIRNALSHSKTGMGVSFEYDELNNNFNLFSMLESLGIDSFYVIESDSMDDDCLKPNVLFTINVVGGDVKDNERFVEKKFIISDYNQEFYPENTSGNYNIFKSFETITLLNTTKKEGG